MAQNTITTKGVLIINGKQVENTFKDLRATTSKLEQELRKLKPGTQAFIEKAEQVKRARAAFENVKNEINATTRELEKSEGFFGRIINKAGGLQNALGAFGAAFGGVAVISSTTQELLKISDAMTDVRKTSGLAQKEVEELWSEFGNFNTRTKRLDLMKIATEGGRLGITDKDKLREFTREIDKIYVALGDSFQGGIEEVTNKVGKLKNLFDETKDSDYPTALNEIGSALNELGANGSSSEANMTDFATRVGQLPSALKPAIDKTLGLGAAFEESGIDAQIASSGYSKFVSVAGNNLDAFAKQMKITKEEAQELFRSKPEEFFLKFGESLKGLSADQTSKILSGLKLNTQEVQKALGAAGDNANRFRELMELSSKAMIDGVSIHNEFTQKNENAAAVWEKIGRGFREFFTDGVIPDIFNWVTEIAGKITGVMSEAGDGMEVFRKRLSIVFQIVKITAAAFVGYKTTIVLSTIATKNHTKAIWLQTVADKAQAAGLFIKRAAILLYNVVLGVLTFNTQRATNAMIAFNAVTKTTPWGIIIGLISAAVTAYYTLSDSVQKVSDKKKMLADANKQVAEETAKEVNNVQQLLKTAQDHSKSLEERQKAVDELNKIVPEYNNQLTIESANTYEATQKLKEYIEKLKDAAREKYFKALVDKKAEELAAAEHSSLEENIEWYEKLWNGMKTGGDIYAAMNANIKTSIKNKQELIKKMERELELANELHLEQKKKNAENGVSTDPTDPTIDDDDGKKPKKYTGDLYGQARKELLKAQRDFIKKQQELEDEETAILEDSLDKQLSAVETKYERKKLALRHENEDYANEIRDLNKKIREASEKIADPETSAEEKSDNSRAIGVYKKIIAEKRNLIEQNNKMEVTLESTKNHELNTTREKYFTKLIQTQNKEFEKCLNLKKAQSDLEIAEIKTLEQAKQKLQEQGYEGQLHKIRTLEDAKKALRKQAEKEILADTLQSLEAQHALLVSGIQSVSGESAEKLIDDLEKLEEKILQIKTAIATGEAPDTSSIKGTEAEGVDVLGFTAGQWEDVFHKLDTTEGKIQAVGMAMQALSNAGQMFADIQKISNDKELASFERLQERKRESHKRQLEQGTMSQERYNKEQERMDKELANKKAELAYKQAKADKVSRLFSAIGSTAQAVAAALTAGPIMGPILAGIVGALGAVQIGIIASQPLPEKQSYAKGGYTKGIGFTDNSGHEVAGVVHAGEYVIPEWLLKDPQVANVAQWLESRRKGSSEEGFAEGGYTSKTDPTEKNPQKMENNEVIQRLLYILEKIEQEGIEAYVISDAKNGKEMLKAIKLYTDLINKNKH